MSTTRKPLPHVELERNKYGHGTLFVNIAGVCHAFDFDTLPELRPLLMRYYDLDVVKEILRQACELSEGIRRL